MVCSSKSVGNSAYTTMREFLTPTENNGTGRWTDIVKNIFSDFVH